MHGGDFMYGHFGAGMPGPYKRKQAEKAAVHQGGLGTVPAWLPASLQLST
jgi:hypothetical protein